MYAALWRFLPGPIVVRILLLIVLAAGVLTILVLWVLPTIDQWLTPQELTVEE